MKNLPYDKTSQNSILDYAKKLSGKSLSEVMDFNNDKLFRGKGKLGSLVEKEYFLLNSGNKPESDFPEAELELKVTGIKVDNKTGKFKAKERLVASMIDFFKIQEEVWPNNSFMKKCKNILFIFYLYEENKYKYRPEEIKFFEPLIFTFDEFQQNLIKYDWQIIRQKILEGKAHELSERNTTYLGACTKGEGHNKDFTSQPFSNIKAKRRAYSLKATFINRIIDFHLNKNPNKYEEPIYITIKRILKPYRNLSRSIICKKLGIEENFSNKSFNRNLLEKMLGSDKYTIPELERITSNKSEDSDCIEVKTITMDSNSKIKESMSFPAFNPMEIISQKWEESTFYKKLDKKFLFVLFERDKEKNYTYIDSFFWDIPHNDMKEAERVWKKTIYQIKNHKSDSLPTQSESNVAHVRPHGRNSDDKIITPEGKLVTKQGFWLNSKYITGQINKLRQKA